MLALGSAHAFGHCIFGGGLQSVEEQRLLASLWRGKVVRHGFGGAGTCWDESAKRRTECCEMVMTYGSAWADDDTRVHALLVVAIGTLSAVSTLVLLKVLVLRHGGLLLG